ncbi:hypothetical protein TorRG33x02_345430 [Trema orientale]|uniref:Uncharacterized protein n=1 Tax=Trema orientale TaxID=63057 RepID=A0A2P5APB7_TREOI|nr:hypothetical protein TorRG33x02_345430 [Trema orientale]
MGGVMELEHYKKTVVNKSTCITKWCTDSPSKTPEAQPSPAQPSTVRTSPNHTTAITSECDHILHLTRFGATTPPLPTRDVCLHYARVMARGIHSACTEPQTLALFSEF